MGEVITLHLVLQDHWNGSVSRSVVLLFCLTEMLHFVCFLSISEGEIWTEMNNLQSGQDKYCSARAKFQRNRHSLIGPYMETTCLNLTSKLLSPKAILNSYPERQKRHQELISYVPSTLTAEVHYPR